MYAGYEVASLSGPPTRGPVQRATLAEPLRSARAPIVLIIEDEPQVSKVFARALAPHASEILTADTCAGGLALGQARQPQLILLDHKLPDGWGTNALARLRAIGVLARVILVSGYLTDDVIERARKLGALDVLDKPVTAERLVATFQMAMALDGPLGRAWATDFEGSPAERWASLVLRAIETPQDPKIREGLARRAAISLSRMKTTCAAVDITAHDTRDLARVLGALVWARRLECTLEALLDIGDERTLERLIARSGLAGRTSTATVRDFLDRQQFVSQDNEAFRLLRHALLGEPEPCLG